MRNRYVELPLVEPIYKTYHMQGPGTAITVNNPSILNWYLNEVMNLECTRKFLNGFTSPELTIVNSYWKDNPYLEQKRFSMQFTNGYINPIIRELLNQGYYVTFVGVDDYYVQGKSWYQERHSNHDGLICGYNQEDKTYCIYAYDNKWIYQKFWTPQKCFNAGRTAMIKKGIFGEICGLKPKLDRVEFCPKTALENILEYLDSTLEKYPKDAEGSVYGIVVHEYISEYVNKLIDGSIAYERMDRRIFRVIWEQKKVMLERILTMEQVLDLGNTFSEKYRSLVSMSDFIRVIYASHHMRRRDSVLRVINEKLMTLMEREREILTEFTNMVRKELWP